MLIVRLSGMSFFNFLINFFDSLNNPLILLKYLFYLRFI